MSRDRKRKRKVKKMAQDDEVAIAPIAELAAVISTETSGGNVNVKDDGDNCQKADVEDDDEEDIFLKPLYPVWSSPEASVNYDDDDTKAERPKSCDVRVYQAPTNAHVAHHALVLRTQTLITSNYDAKKDAPPPITAHCGLAELIYPFKVDDFLEQFFPPTAQNQNLPNTAIHFTCIDNQSKLHRQRIKDLVENEMLELDPKRLFEQTSSDSIFVWLRPQPVERDAAKLKNGKQLQAPQASSSSPPPPSSLIASMEVTDLSNALALLHCGHATYCRVPPEVEQPLVASLLRDTGLGCGQYDPSGTNTRCMGRGEVELFISSTCQHVTDWHFDFQENFTVQLSGTKRWTLQSGTIDYPLRGCTPHYASPSSVEGQLQAAHLVDRKFRFGTPQLGVNSLGKPETCVLHPGDVLFFPAGMWHKVETIEPGVSINISLMATNYANLVCQSLQHALLQRPEWRRPVAINHTSSANSNVLEHLQLLLSDLPNLIQTLTTEHDLARCILPPVLQHAPTFMSSMNEQRGKHGKEDDDNDDDEYSDEDENDSSNTANDTVIAIAEFKVPSKWTACPDPKAVLIKNPLATLTRMDEITSFYAKSSSATKKNEGDATTLFALHVNYAGNEMLESAIRVVFRDDPQSKCLEKLYNFTENQPQQETCHLLAGTTALIVGSKLITSHRQMVDCMVYYGYLQWRPSPGMAAIKKRT